jgi:thioredoxin-dependent peroxiredoxin
MPRLSRLTIAVAVVAALAAGAGPRLQAADLAVGDPAPDWSLAASDGKTYRLADFKGRKAVVIAWFPRAFTQGCTIECRSLAANGEKIRRHDVAYFMASTDPVDGEKGNQAFAASEKADFPVLSDPTKEVAAAYGVLNPERGVARRWTFYIGTDGRIAAIDKEVKPATSAEDLLARLAELKVPLAK